VHSPRAKDVPELLAPAGNLDTALAAFEHGADAVYGGLKRFNARERTENFTVEEYSRLIRYADERNKRVYLTFNTLIRDDELREAAEILEAVAGLAPHAVIVQDLGVLDMLRTHLPGLEIHGSTQMGIHNSAGANLLHSLGVARVILERQVTYEEIELIRKRTRIGLEVFIHGALCCGLSGACLFSSWIGGWSGNRGKCKQPCRRRYHHEDGNGFFFSPNDLYSLDAIPVLKRIGVTSLKIEGRLRKADYVAPVVRAYRLVLDNTDLASDDDTVAPALLKEARAILSDSHSRYWSRGFRTEQDFGGVIDHESLGVSGSLCGGVVDTADNGFLVQARRSIKVGDKIRVQPPSGDEGPGIVVSRISVDGRPTDRISRNRRGFIHCDKPVPPDGRVYLTGRNERPYLNLIDTIEPYTLAVSMNLTVSDTGYRADIRPCHAEPDSEPVVWEYPFAIQQARTLPIDPQTVSSEFKKVRGGTVRIVRVECRIDGSLFLQQRDIRHARQAFETWLAERHFDTAPIYGPATPAMDRGNSEDDRAERPPGLDSQSEDTPSGGKRAAYTVTRIRSVRQAFDDSILRESLPLIGDNERETPIVEALQIETEMDRKDVTALRERYGDALEVVLPPFCPEKDIEALTSTLRMFWEVGVVRFRATSFYGIELLRILPGVEITAAGVIPAANSRAFALLLRLRCRKVSAWVELDAKSQDRLAAKYGGDCEILIYGRIPLLRTRAEIPVRGTVRDGRGGAFRVAGDERLVTVLADEVFGRSDPGICCVCLDLTHTDPGEPSTGRFNLDRELS